MPIKTTVQRSNLATAYGAAATEARLYSTVPDTAAGTAIVGATAAISWSAASNGVITAEVVFNVPSGATVAGAGVHNGSGAYLDGGAVPSQNFASDGTYTLTLTYAQS